VALFGPAFVGSIALVQRNVAIGTFCCVWTLFVSLVQSQAVYRLIVPSQIFALLLGFDALFTGTLARRAVYAFAVLFVVVDVMYVRGESGKMSTLKDIWQEIRVT
jgi:hypothetical protein